MAKRKIEVVEHSTATKVKDINLNKVNADAREKNFASARASSIANHEVDMAGRPTEEVEEVETVEETEGEA